MTAEGNVAYTAYRDGGRWMEAVFQADDGDPLRLVPQRARSPGSPEMHEGRRFPMTAPFIGAAVSYDNGQTWDDLALFSPVDPRH
jgi:hypothetical protein